MAATIPIIDSELNRTVFDRFKRRAIWKFIHIENMFHLGKEEGGCRMSGLTLV